MKNIRSLTLIFIMAMTLTGCLGKQEDLYKNLSAQQIYERGQKAAKSGNNSQAIKDFDTLEIRYPYGEYTDKGQLALIKAYADSDEGVQALATANRFIRMHPRHPDVDFAYYMKGIVNYNENFTFAFKQLPLDRSMRTSEFAQHSYDDFKTLIEKFPNSQYVPDAKIRMAEMREQLADHELHVAKYYEIQGADLAAANRAAYIVTNYQGTEAVPKALLIMHKSYMALGMKEQANEAMAILQKDFPDYHKKR